MAPVPNTQRIPKPAHVAAMKRIVVRRSPNGVLVPSRPAGIPRLVDLALSGDRIEFPSPIREPVEFELWACTWLGIVAGTRLLEVDGGLLSEFLAEIGGVP